MAYSSTYAFRPTTGTATTDYASSLDSLSQTAAADAPTLFVDQLVCNKIYYRNPVNVGNGYSPTNKVPFGTGTFDGTSGLATITSPFLADISDVAITLYEADGGGGIPDVAFGNLLPFQEEGVWLMPPQGTPETLPNTSGTPGDGWDVGVGVFQTDTNGAGFSTPHTKALQTNLVCSMEVNPRRTAFDLTTGTWTLRGPKGMNFRWYIVSGSLV